MFECVRTSLISSWLYVHHCPSPFMFQQGKRNKNSLPSNKRNRLIHGLAMSLAMCSLYLCSSERAKAGEDHSVNLGLLIFAGVQERRRPEGFEPLQRGLNFCSLAGEIGELSFRPLTVCFVPRGSFSWWWKKYRRLTAISATWRKPQRFLSK